MEVLVDKCIYTCLGICFVILCETEWDGEEGSAPFSCDFTVKLSG